MFAVSRNFESGGLPAFLGAVGEWLNDLAAQFQDGEIPSVFNLDAVFGVAQLCYGLITQLFKTTSAAEAISHLQDAPYPDGLIPLNPKTTAADLASRNVSACSIILGCPRSALPEAEQNSPTANVGLEGWSIYNVLLEIKEIARVQAMPLSDQATAFVEYIK